MPLPGPSRNFSARPASRTRTGPPPGPAFERFFAPIFLSAKPFATSSRSAAGTTSSTRPALFARFASRTLPARMTSRAPARPIIRGRRVVPPHAGRIPSLISGRPICVFGESDARRQSIERTVSQPPPRQAPSIAATVGNGRFASLLNVRCGPRTISGSAPLSAVAISFTSAPAMKMPGLREIRTRAFTSARAASESSIRSNSSITGREYLLTFSPGVSNSRTARPSASTVRRKADVACRAPAGVSVSFSSKVMATAAFRGRLPRAARRPPPPRSPF